MDILTELNPQQQQAVTFGQGPVLVLAGAGSGKTRALTHRAAWLIQENKATPDQIVLLTFTNKAAQEMLDRVQHLAGTAAAFGGTFHSFCARILRKQGYLVGLEPGYIIYDTEDQEMLIKVALDQSRIDPKKYKPRSVLAAISGAKNELLSPADYLNSATNQWQETVGKLYVQYQQLLLQAGAVDFDDLLFTTVNLFRHHPQVLEQYQQQFKYLLVDEYQDTNKAQYTLVRQLANHWRNLMAVGDFSQSIYSWRGADFRNLQNLPRDFPDLQIINLEQNYRSTQAILDGAYQIIQKNTQHPILKLWTTNPEGQKITIYSARSELDEAAFVVQTIAQLTLSEAAYSDFAVLYRTNAQSRVLEEALLHAGIPYTLVGGIRFYQRKEIKDVLSYLRLIANPRDSVSKERIIKLGKARWLVFQQWLGEHTSFGKVENSSLDEESTASHLSSSTTIEILDKVLNFTHYLDRYDPEDAEDLARLENIKELRSVAERFPDLNTFLENVALVEKETIEENQDVRASKVTLMTLHAAKGLEFPQVFMVGMEEGLFPHSRALMNIAEMEEERRLCYVGMTRAMQKLYLTYAHRRLYFGRSASYAVSRFVADLPQRLIANPLPSSTVASTDFDDWGDPGYRDIDF